MYVFAGVIHEYTFACMYWFVCVCVCVCVYVRACVRVCEESYSCSYDEILLGNDKHQTTYRCTIQF